jgi:hypothetical protein
MNARLLRNIIQGRHTMRNLYLSGLVLSILVVCATGILAQEPELTEDQQKAFNQRKLSLEVQGISMGSFGSSIYSATTWRRWTAYKGFTPMTEQEFFLLTGYENEAARARSYKNGCDGMTAAGIILAIAGGVAAVIGASRTTTTHYDYGYGIEGDIEESDPDEGLFIGGLVVCAIGSGLLWAGIAGSQMNWAPYATVEGIANDYNKQLLIRIRKEF